MRFGALGRQEFPLDYGLRISNLFYTNAFEGPLAEDGRTYGNPLVHREAHTAGDIVAQLVDYAGRS